MKKTQFAKWGYARDVSPQEKKEKCTPARSGKTSRSSAFFSRRRFFGSDLGGRRPSADRQKRAPKKYQPSALFFPSVTDNVCKNDFSLITCAKIGISRAGVDVRTRGTKIRALDGRASPPSFSRRGGLLSAPAVAGSIFLRKPKIANAIFCSSVTGENT